MRHLRDDVRRRAEAVDADRSRVARHLQASPADETGAEQRRLFSRIGAFGQREAEGRVGYGVRGIAAVARVAGEKRVVAQVFALRRAIGTATAGVAEPWHADALPGFQAGDAGAERIDDPDDLVARRDRKPRLRQFAVDDVEVCAADSAGEDAQANFAGSGRGQGTCDLPQARAGRRKAHRAHSVRIVRFAHLAAFHDPSSCAARLRRRKAAPGRSISRSIARDRAKGAPVRSPRKFRAR